LVLQSIVLPPITHSAPSYPLSPPVFTSPPIHSNVLPCYLSLSTLTIS
jgi:hypothetical protein